MPNIIPARGKKTFGQVILGGLAEGLPGAIEKYQGQKLAQSQMKQENEAAKRMGIDLSGVKDPKVRQEMWASALKGQEQENQNKFLKEMQAEKYRLESVNEQEKRGAGSVEDIKSYNTIEKRFGKEAADLWLSSTEGGRTVLIENLLENEQRGGKLNQQLGTEQKEIGKEIPEVPAMKTKDYDKGLTPKERVARGNDRYAKNLPLYQDSVTKLRAQEAITEDLSMLGELSPQISGVERLNINPMTGELLIPALASKEAQRFVKIVNDFTVQAKDSFGARVSNFELDRFMKRLPTLANSEEGRNEIIQQMKIMNDMNSVYQQTLQNVIDEHGGIRNIDYDEAERLATKQSKKEVERLRKEFKNIDSSLDIQERKKLDEFKKNSPKDKIAVRKSDGEIGYINKDKVSAFIKNKAGEVL